jgi:hypothetical protein
MYIFVISIKDGSFDIPFDLFKEKKSFHRIEESMSSKKFKMQATTQYLLKRFFNKQVLDFHRPSKILCQTFGRQNHWFLLLEFAISVEYAFLKSVYLCMA